MVLTKRLAMVHMGPFYPIMEISSTKRRFVDKKENK